MLDEAAKALNAAVKLRVDAARKQFTALKKLERERLTAEAESRQPEHQAELFGGSYDAIWIQSCPSCGCRAFMTGEQSGEVISDEYDEHDSAIWEIVDREFVGQEFHCPTCDLALKSSDEVTAAGLNYIFKDRQEREMEYEPEYGND